jgi:hypothetical protein
MTTMNWVFEDKSFPQPLQAAIRMAAALLVRAREVAGYVRGFPADADYMDDEEFLDAWVRSQDSVSRSVPYRFTAGVDEAHEDSRMSALRAACERTGNTKHRTWVIAESLK